MQEFTLDKLEKDTKRLLRATFSVIDGVGENQIDKLIYMAAKVENANWQLELFKPNTTVYKKLKEANNIYQNNMFKEIYKLCNGNHMLEDSIINTLAYYAGMRGKYFKEASNKA